jgi:uncharacterized protein YbjT (DUF2867 family)
MNKTYAITGAIGYVGKEVVEKLTAQGHRVRPVSRKAGVSIDDAAALTQAFSGVDGALLMIPFDMKAPDLHRREDEIGIALAEAVKNAGVRRVVFLSGTSVHLKERSGSALGASMMEERLDGLGIAELAHLRGCFFMENFFNMGIIAQAQTGTFATVFRPDIAMPMVAAKDVGEKAVELLTEEPFRQPRVREVLGARDYTMAEATGIIGAIIGEPELEYAQISYEDARRQMLGVGLSPSFVDAVTETARSFNQGIVWAREKRSPQNTTTSTLEQFAEEVFRKACDATVTGVR